MRNSDNPSGIWKYVRCFWFILTWEHKANINRLIISENDLQQGQILSLWRSWYYWLEKKKKKRKTGIRVVILYLLYWHLERSLEIFQQSCSHVVDLPLCGVYKYKSEKEIAGDKNAYQTWGKTFLIVEHFWFFRVHKEEKHSWCFDLNLENNKTIYPRRST